MSISKNSTAFMIGAGGPDETDFVMGKGITVSPVNLKNKKSIPSKSETQSRISVRNKLHCESIDKYWTENLIKKNQIAFDFLALSSNFTKLSIFYYIFCRNIIENKKDEFFQSVFEDFAAENIDLAISMFSDEDDDYILNYSSWPNLEVCAPSEGTRRFRFKASRFERISDYLLIKSNQHQKPASYASQFFSGIEPILSIQRELKTLISLQLHELEGKTPDVAKDSTNKSKHKRVKIPPILDHLYLTWAQ